MKNYTMIELENDNKYIIVDMLEYDNKKFFLLAQVLNETDINNEFEIYVYNAKTNSFDEIENELEYNYVKEVFSNRLNELRNELEKIDNKILNIIKLKVVDIREYSYIFEKTNGETIVMDVEIFGNLKIQINDYLYISEDTTKENITVRFGPIITDKTEIIKVVREEKIYYLQRYYG